MRIIKQTEDLEIIIFKQGKVYKGLILMMDQSV